MSKKLVNVFIPLLLVLIAAVLIRIMFPWGEIFPEDHVNYSGVDSYYQMNIIRQVYQGNLDISVPTFYHEFIIGVGWLLAGGHSTFSFIESVAVFIPVLFAACTVILVYLLGRRLFSNMVGIIAAAAVAILPGEFLGRSCLGSVDYHAAEVFFSTAAIYFICHIVTATKLLSWRNIITAVLAGGSVFAYVKVWSGAVGFIPIFGFFGFYIFVNHFQNRKYIWVLVWSAAAVALAVVVPGIIDKVFHIFGRFIINTGEAQPFWSDYFVFIHVILAGFFLYIYTTAAKSFRLPLIFWTGIMLAATIWQRRFDYYLIIPFSLLLGYNIELLYRKILKWEDEDG